MANQICDLEAFCSARVVCSEKCWTKISHSGSMHARHATAQKCRCSCQTVQQTCISFSSPLQPMFLLIEALHFQYAQSISSTEHFREQDTHWMTYHETGVIINLSLGRILDRGIRFSFELQRDYTTLLSWFVSVKHNMTIKLILIPHGSILRMFSRQTRHSSSMWSRRCLLSSRILYCLITFWRISFAVKYQSIALVYFSYRHSSDSF